MTLLRCITGSETFKNGSAQLMVSLMHTPAKPLEHCAAYSPGKGMFISEASKGRHHVSSSNRPVYLPAANNGVKELGNYFDNTFNVDDGVVLKVYARRRVLFGGNRPSIRQGVVFIQPRAEAPLNRLRLIRIDDNLSTNADVIIEGRFDILSLRDVGAAGVAITADDLNLCKAANVREVLEYVELAPAITARGRVKVERVINRDGTSVALVSTRTRRPIALD